MNYGVAFPVILPDQPYKYLGVRGTMLGDFTAEKEHVLSDMVKKLAALKEDRLLTQKEKEQIIVIAVCSVFNYSAGVVDWSKTELDRISMMWARAFKTAWTLPRSADNSPFILDESHAGRDCPSATGMWIRAVLDVFDQSVSLPGEISEMVIKQLRRQCNAFGCQTLNQLQLMLRVSGSAETVLELFLQRLDEQGLEISSPWRNGEEESLAEGLWPALHRAWLRKQQWLGCTELEESVQTEWDRAQLCMRACRKLGNVEPAIWAASHLRGSQHRWLDAVELRRRQCHLTPAEYGALVSWLPPCKSTDSCRVDELATVCPGRVGMAVADNGTVPPCIAGKLLGIAGQHQLILQSALSEGLSAVEVSRISDSELATALCHHRAIFPLSQNDNEAKLVECLAPLRRVMDPYPLQQEYILARLVDSPEDPIAALSLALVRDCLLGVGRENLQEACSRPQWVVSEAEFYSGCSFSVASDSAPEWNMKSTALDGQCIFTGLVQYISARYRPRLQRPAVVLHPWQSEPPLPSNVSIDTTHHHPRLMPSPEGWEVWQRNGRVWIAESRRRVAMIDAAQYGMLAIMWTGLGTQPIPSSQFLQQLCKSCRLQLDSDSSHGVSWSRHLLTNIQQATGASLLIGASAATYNPHFLHYASPFPDDVALGAVREWPMVPALLLLDSFAPPLRAQLLQKAALHLPGVWVLRQHKGQHGPSDLTSLQHHGATLIAELPKNSEVLHETRCWAEAAWDVRPSRHVTQLWHLSNPPASDRQRDVPCPETVRHRMEGRGHYRFSFHWCEHAVPARLQYYRQHQQDALRFSWDGMIAGTDGSVDEKTESMGAGYVVGADPTPHMTLSIRVGGPLSTTRAEAASLLQLVRDLGNTSTCRICLLVFVDCLVVLEILSKWGRWDYHPRPKEIVHFDVISQLLVELRKWPGSIKLVKVKSHSGCLLNERADEEAERGRTTEGPELCPGPQKYGALWLRIRPSTRAACGQPLPRDSAPNASIIKKVVAANILRAVQKRNTAFVRDLFHRQDGNTVSSIIRRCRPAEYRVWLRCMMGIYPTQTYLHRVGLAASQLCPFCSSAVPETLAHFACVCPQFREARTSAHNQVRQVVTSFLTPLLQSHWKVYEETQMQHTGLTLRLIPAARVAEALGHDPDPNADPDAVKDLGRWQPDWVFVSTAKKRIALVDLCRSADGHPHQLVAAGIRKQQRYGPLVEALSHYSDNGWLIHVFPWVVGIRGMIDPRLIGALLGFLTIPQKHWRPAVERTALASVQALYFLHRVRFGGRSEDRRAGLTHQCGDDSDGECEDAEVLELQATRKRKKDTVVDGYETSPEDVLAATCRKRRMNNHHSMTPHQSHTPARAASRQPQFPDTRRGSTQTNKSSLVRRRRTTGRSNSKCTRVDQGACHPMQSAETNDQEYKHRGVDRQPNYQQSTLCKRKLSSSANHVYDTDDPDERNRKQPRHSTGAQLDILWSRWRQLADRRRN